MESIRFWALDNPNGWYATYITPHAPYSNMLPLCGQAIVTRNGQREQVGVVATSKIVPADEVAGWKFQFYVLLGSLTQAQEDQMKEELTKLGQALEQEQLEQATRVQREPRREDRRGDGQRGRAAEDADRSA